MLQCVSSTIPISTPTKHMAKWPSLLSRMAFLPTLSDYEGASQDLWGCGANEGINKDMCGTKLLSTTVSAYPVLVSVTY